MNPKSPNRNKLGRRIAPGIWEDADGNPHINIEELLVMFGLKDTPENRVAATQLVREALRKQCPDAQIIERATPED